MTQTFRSPDCFKIEHVSVTKGLSIIGRARLDYLLRNQPIAVGDDGVYARGLNGLGAERGDMSTARGR
jgi:hypothetical protein